MGKGKIVGREIFLKTSKGFPRRVKEIFRNHSQTDNELTEVARKLNVVWLHWFLDRLRRVFNLSVVSGGWLGSVSGGMAVSLLGLWGVDGGSLVGDISDESVDVVSSVSGGLDSAVGKSDHEATSNDTVGILSLGLLEVGLAVVVSNSVLVGVWLRGELLWDVWSGGAIGGGSSSESCGDESGGNEDLEHFVS